MKKIWIIGLFSVVAAHLFAQEPRSKADTARSKINNQMDANMDMGGMDMKGMNMDSSAAGTPMDMSNAYSRNLPMGRDGSGTAWLPDESPMTARMFHTRNWMYMLHYNLFLRYDNQDFTGKGTRGGSKFDAPDFIMLMAQHPVGKNGLFHYSIMSSLDALTGGNGYPLLFQSGESYRGKPIVDRQHPHDLFSELSVSYAQALSSRSDVFVYIGYPGEPALGPVAFMHRPSAMDEPDAPISHHWIDATHITFGVVTAGIRYGAFKLDGSSFTGREPDENRYNFDKPRFDSWSGRVSCNPTGNWALQVSHGFIKSPELLHPGENVHRTTASAIYSRHLGTGALDATVIWGMNKSPGRQGEQAALVEGDWRKNRLGIYTRGEWVQKGTEELNLPAAVYGDAVFPVQSYTIGLNYDLFRWGGCRIAAGGQWTQYHADERLDSLYGRNPMAFECYIRVYPAAN